MKLRAKLFLPLMLFSLLFGAYIHFVWLQQAAAGIESRAEQDQRAHLVSVAEGLINLLLEEQLANIYENLNALMEKNQNWISIRLVNESGEQLYPLDAVAPATPDSLPKYSRLLHQSVGFVEPGLARLELVVDFTPLHTSVMQLEKTLSFAFLMFLTAFVLVTTGVVELVVRRRLKKLSRAADHLADGYFDTLLPESNEDEIGDLVNSFAMMRDALQSNNLKLKGEIEEHRNTSIQLVEQQEKIHNIIDNSTNLFYSHTVDFVFSYLSPQTRDFLDCEPVEVQERWTEFVIDSPKNNAGFAVKQEAIRSGERQPPYQLELIGRKGRKIVVEVHEAPVVRDGKTVAMVGSLTDITEKKQAEKDQERLQRELQQSQKMEALGQFTGGVAHDFNNVMGIIQGYSELARNYCVKDDEDKASGYFDHIQHALDRAVKLVAQMMAFSRKSDIDLAPLSFHEIIKEDLLMLRSLLPTTIQIESEIDENLPKVLMDQAQIHQLLINLGTNARDAMEGKGVMTVRLGWARDIDEECTACHAHVHGDWIGLSVTDTGNGIDQASLERIFNPFFTTKDVGKGTGLGMAVIDGIMRSHNGHIIVNTEKGEGTSFLLTFQPVSDEEETIVEEVVQPVVEKCDGKGERILVVDDENDLAKFVAEMLAMHGYETTMLTSSVDALALYKERKDEFSLLITDQTMPEMTGMELVKEIRAINPDMPALLCTGFSETVDEQIAKDNNVAFMKKPVKVNEFLEMVRQSLKAA